MGTLTRMSRIFVGPRLRSLRADRGLNQVSLAEMLEISPSYLNQIEHNQRPLTVPVLLRLTELFGLDPEFFSPEDGTRLVADLREALPGASPTEIADLASAAPRIAHAIVDLDRSRQQAAEHAAVLAGAHQSAPAPYELVRDFFYDRHNYIDELDRAAERLTDGHAPATAAEQRLAAHNVRIITTPGARRLYDPAARTLSVSPHLTPAQRTFQLATQIALLEYGDLLTELVGTATFTDEHARALTRIGLANYFAGAFLLPYRTFRDAAEHERYDLDALGARFAVSFETVCHRLSTLQRPRLRGVPFSFVRVDRAGNISKRQSATGFHFTRAGGSCPLWAVYEAFSTLGALRTQVAEMPDGRRYFWVARTVRRRSHHHATPDRLYSIGLGCELRHAHRLAYAHGLDLAKPATTPIGLGCKVCERTDCAQRAFPPTGRDLRINPDLTGLTPYAPA